MYSCILYICMYVCIWPAAKLNSVFDVAYRARFMNIDRLPLMRGIDCGTFAGSDSSIRSVSIPAPNASSLVCRNVHTSDSFFVLSFSLLFCSRFFFFFFFYHVPLDTVRTQDASLRRSVSEFESRLLFSCFSSLFRCSHIFSSPFLLVHFCVLLCSIQFE